MPLVPPLPADHDPEIAELALFGFLNRWNDSMGTELEAPAAEIGRTHLAAAGWTPGKHGGGAG